MRLVPTNFLNGLMTGKSGNRSDAVVIMSQGEGYDVQRLFYTYFIGYKVEFLILKEHQDSVISLAFISLLYVLR